MFALAPFAGVIAALLLWLGYREVRDRRWTAALTFLAMGAVLMVPVLLSVIWALTLPGKLD